MSRRWAWVAILGLIVAVGAQMNQAARATRLPIDDPRHFAIQPPEPPEPPRPPRGEGRDQPGPMRGGEPMPGRGMMIGGGTQMSASGKFLYILRGDEILQFEATSLEFIKRVRLPAQERERPNRPEGGRGERGEPKGDRPRENPPAEPTPAGTLSGFNKAKPADRTLAFYSLDWAANLKEALARGKAERRPIFLIANTNITAGCNFYTGHT